MDIKTMTRFHTYLPLWVATSLHRNAVRPGKVLPGTHSTGLSKMNVLMQQRDSFLQSARLAH